MKDTDQSRGHGRLPAENCAVCGAVIGSSNHRAVMVQGERVRFCGPWCEAKWEAEQEAQEDPAEDARQRRSGTD
jgi:hypothetical protein